MRRRSWHKRNVITVVTANDCQSSITYRQQMAVAVAAAITYYVYLCLVLLDRLQLDDELHVSEYSLKYKKCKHK